MELTITIPLEKSRQRRGGVLYTVWRAHASLSVFCLFRWGYPMSVSAPPPLYITWPATVSEVNCFERRFDCHRLAISHECTDHCRLYSCIGKERDQLSTSSATRTSVRKSLALPHHRFGLPEGNYQQPRRHQSVAAN